MFHPIEIFENFPYCIVQGNIGSKFSNDAIAETRTACIVITRRNYNLLVDARRNKA